MKHDAEYTETLATRVQGLKDQYGNTVALVVFEKTFFADIKKCFKLNPKFLK